MPIGGRNGLEERDGPTVSLEEDPVASITSFPAVICFLGVIWPTAFHSFISNHLHEILTPLVVDYSVI